MEAVVRKATVMRLEDALTNQEAASSQEEGKENRKEYIQCISAKGL